MAPVLLLLATHVALALNSNRYNATESSIKREHVNHLQRENFPPEDSTFLNREVINGAVPHDYDERYYNSKSQTWSTRMPFGGNNEVTDFKPTLLGETAEGDETEFTTAQTYNKYIDPRSAGDESARTVVNSINFTKADYNVENNETKEEIPRPLENTTNSYYQDLNNGYNRTYANLNKHLKPSIKSRKQESIKPKDRGDKNPAKINNYETLADREVYGVEGKNCSLPNNQTSARNNFECSTDTNLIKFSVSGVNSSGNSIKPTEHRRVAPGNSPIPVLSKLMNTLKPNSGRFDKTPTDTTRNPRIWEGLQTTNTPNALPSYTINRAQIGRTKDAHRQQNRSISPELIGTGLRFKSAVIKRAHSPTTNQSTPSAGDLANDSAALFNTGLGDPLGTTNSFVITHHQGILNDSPSRETKSSHHFSDNQASTVAPSPENLYTVSTREVSESYVNRFTKFPAGENTDAVSLSPTSTSPPDTVHQKFQEGLKTTLKKSILQATREPVTESQGLAGDTLNESHVNLNFRNALSTPVYNSVKRNLVQVDTGLTVEPLEIYEPITPCTNCPNATDRVATTTISGNSDTQRNKLGDEIADLDLTTRQNFNDKNAISNANLSRATFGHDGTATDNFFTHLNVSQGFVAVSSRQDKTEKSMLDVTPVSPSNATADEVSDIYEGLLMTTSASDEIVGALNVTAEFNDNDTFAVNISSTSVKVISEFPWPVKKEAVVEGDLVLGGLMMVHEREDTVTCGPVMPQGGIQALEAMLYTLDRLNEASTSLLPNITLGAHILDDCDKDTYGLEMAVDFIKGSNAEASSSVLSSLPIITSPLDDDIIKVLGEESKEVRTFSKPIHEDIAKRWDTILKSGLKSETTTELITKYPPPSNCARLKAPKLNTEVGGSAGLSAVGRDNRLTNYQNQIGAATAAVGKFMSILLEKSEGGGAIST